MIPALLTRSVKRSYTLPEGEFDGIWQDRFCWLFNARGECFARIDTAHKTQKGKSERVTVRVNVSDVLIFEKLKQKRT